MANDVVIRVTSDDDTSRGFNSARRKAKELDRDTRGIFDGLGKDVISIFDRVGNTVGATFSQAFGDSISVLGRTIGPMLGPVGVGIALGLAGPIASTLGAAVSTAVLAAVGGGVVAAGIALVSKSPMVKAAADRLRNSVADKSTKSDEDNIAQAEARLEAAYARLDKARAVGTQKSVDSALYDIEIAKKKLAEAKQGLVDTMTFNKNNTSFQDLAKPFEGPVSRAIDTFTAAIERAKGSIGGLFEKAAPVVDKLAPRLVEMAEKAGPGFAKAFEASLPLFDILADRLPEIGEAIGDFFQTVADHGPEAQEFFSLLIDFIINTIDQISWLVDVFSNGWASMSDTVSAFGAVFSAVWNGAKAVFFSVVSGMANMFFNVVGMILSGAAKAFSWVPGVGEKLARASAEFSSFRDRANAALAGIRDRHVTVTIDQMFRTFGKPYSDVTGIGGNTFRGLASGGIVGAASGGSRSGLVMVGERGRELIDFQQGRVYSNNQTEQMMSGSGGPMRVEVELKFVGNADSMLVSALQKLAREGKLTLPAKAVV